MGRDKIEWNLANLKEKEEYPFAKLIYKWEI